MNMHAMNMQLTVVVGADWTLTHGVTTQVMLGVSMRAMWDTTLVGVIVIEVHISK